MSVEPRVQLFLVLTQSSHNKGLRPVNYCTAALPWPLSLSTALYKQLLLSRLIDENIDEGYQQ